MLLLLPLIIPFLTHLATIRPVRSPSDAEISVFVKLKILCSAASAVDGREHP